MSTKLNRRQAMARMAALATASGLPFGFDAATAQMSATADLTPWLAPTIKPVTAAGYGTDPDLLHPQAAPWPTTLSKRQLELVGALADIVIPAENASPPATAVGVPAVIDEWVSAPYPMQRAHRQLVLAGLQWVDAEAKRRFAANFVQLTAAQRLTIVDELAEPASATQAADENLTRASEFFDGFRRLVAGAYYTSPQGVEDLGYEGNVPIAGDYPGPSKAAMRHLQGQLNDLGLTLPPQL